MGSPLIYLHPLHPERYRVKRPRRPLERCRASGAGYPRSPRNRCITTRFARRVIRQDAARARRESEEAQLERFKDRVVGVVVSDYL